MRFWMLVLAAASELFGADEQRLALAVRAESAFARVQMSANPEVSDAAACAQAEAALLPVVAPQELSLVRFRKGYCTLAGAAITRNPAEFTAAAYEFDRAMVAWSERSAGKDKPPEPIPSALLVLAAVARLNAGGEEEARNLARNQIVAAETHAACRAALMPVSFCEAMHATGREWLGWLALEGGDVASAARHFSGATGWQEWVAGRRAFDEHRYAEAAAQYRRAIELLNPAAAPSLAARLGPMADKGRQLTDLGGAQLLAGDTATSLATLDAAVKASPGNPRPLYLRARARELAGQPEAALADYNLASRTAFADAKNLASGEAHLYRGIMLYRRKDFPHAEDEFASALNFEIPSGMRADAIAWRHLAAVAGGSCQASRDLLDQSLFAASPYFPRDEARAAAGACRSGSARTAAQGALEAVLNR